MRAAETGEVCIQTACSEYQEIHSGLVARMATKLALWLSVYKQDARCCRHGQNWSSGRETSPSFWCE